MGLLVLWKVSGNSSVSKKRCKCYITVGSEKKIVSNSFVYVSFVSYVPYNHND